MSHPFQVLFVDSAINLKTTETLQQFDFLGKDDSIEVSGNLTLVHYSGRIQELRAGTVKISELNDADLAIGEQSRPMLDPAFRYSSAFVDGQVRGSPTFKWLYPGRKSRELELYKTENLVFAWEVSEYLIKRIAPQRQVYIFTIKNIFDEILFKCETTHSSISIPGHKAETKENLIIISVTLKGENEEIFSGDYGVRIVENPPLRPNVLMHYTKTKYREIIEALEIDNRGISRIAGSLYQKAIESSNHDPRFEKLYENFLERNPTLKSTSE